MVKLNDAQLAMVMDAARQLQPALRDTFLRRIANSLHALPIEDRSLHSAITGALHALQPTRRDKMTFGPRAKPRNWA